MSRLKFLPFRSIRFFLLLCVGSLSIYGCSGSSEPGTDNVQPASESVVPDAPDTSSSSEVVDPVSPAFVQVDFAVTVPAYMSDSLQMRLNWGDIESVAVWVRDETWAISDMFPTNSEDLLVVTFADANGAITLGTFEMNFRTGAAASEGVQIAADQFDTERWDDDSDGTSNLSELIMGMDPLVADSPVMSSQLPFAVQAGLELVQDKTFRISWQPSEGATFYRVLENPDGLSGFSPISMDLDGSIQTLEHRVALFSRVNARYIVQACNVNGCVDSQELIVSGSLEQAVGYFKASNSEEFDRFGEVVSLSGDGNTMAVSATAEASSANGVNNDQSDNSLATAGAVYVFNRLNGGWEQQAYLKASNPGGQDRFGSSLSLSRNGNTLAVGARFETGNATGINGNQDDNSATRAGAVYVFERNGGGWQQQAYVKASNTDADDLFGESVSLSATGNTLVVGASRESSTATGVNGDQSINRERDESGAVYVFARSGEDWRQEAYLKASNSRGRLFGQAVSLSADGNSLVVGAPGENSAATGVNGDQNLGTADFSGAAYVFVRSDETWQQQAYLKPSNTGIQDLFGSALSLSADGNTLAVGAFREDGAAVGIDGDQSDNSAGDAGAVYIFVRVDGVWRQQVYLKGNNTDELYEFGGSVSLSEDGNTLVVGADGESSAGLGVDGTQVRDFTIGTGAAYVFIRSSGGWQQRAIVKASNADSQDSFGSSVAVSTDANTLAVGAPFENSSARGINGNQADNSSSSSGAVYLY